MWHQAHPDSFRESEIACFSSDLLAVGGAWHLQVPVRFLRRCRGAWHLQVQARSDIKHQERKNQCIEKILRCTDFLVELVDADTLTEQLTPITEQVVPTSEHLATDHSVPDHPAVLEYLVDHFPIGSVAVEA